MAQIFMVFMLICMVFAGNSKCQEDYGCNSMIGFGVGAQRGEYDHFLISFNSDLRSSSTKYLPSRLSIYSTANIAFRKELNGYAMSMDAFPIGIAGAFDLWRALLGQSSNPGALSYATYVLHAIPNSDLRIHLSPTCNVSYGPFAGHRLQIYPLSVESKMNSYGQAGFFVRLQNIEFQVFAKNEYLVSPEWSLGGMLTMTTF